MTTSNLSLIELARLCITKAVSLPADGPFDRYITSRACLYYKAEQLRAQHDELYGVNDDEGPVGCRTDESWL